MPMVVAGAAASAAMAGFAQGFTIAVLGKAFLSSLVLGMLSQALAPKPKKNPAAMNQITSNTFAVRQSDSTRKHVYGLTRFTDVYAQIVSTGANGKLHVIVIISDDEWQSIDEIWVNDYPISPDHMDAEGNVISGRYNGKLRIRIHLGSPNQTADPVAVAEISEWTTNCRLRGICHLIVTMTKDQDIFPNGMPNFSVIGKARKIFDPRLSVSQWTPNLALFAYDYLRLADYGYLAEEDDVSLTNIAAAANIADEIVDTLPMDMSVASVAAATDIITLSGDRLQFEICDRVELVTAGTPPAGLATGTDYYIIPYQIKTTPRIKLATSLDNAVAGLAINITSAGSGAMTIRKTGEPRYHGAGVIDTADTLEDGFNQILASMAGRMVCAGGAWRLLPGAWTEPVLDLGLGDFRGMLGTRTKTAMAERFNTVSGVFISQLNDYQKSDYPSYRNQNFIDEDNGREYPRDHPLGFTGRPTACRRIAKLETLRARQEMVHTVPASMRAAQAQAGDNLTLTIERRGWAEKPFELTNFGLSAQADGENIELITNLTLRETAEAIYEWAASDDDPDFDLAPNTNLPDAFTVLVPTGVAFSSRVVETVDADQVYTLVLMWDAHPDAFVQNNGMFEIQFKLSAETDWRPSFRVAGNLVFSDVLVSSVGEAYDLRIRAINNLGVRSGWTTLENATVGSSGGVGSTEDWEGVADSVGTSLDWGSVADAVIATIDRGEVV